MKFNEAIDEVRSHENTYDETSGTMQTFSVLDMIDELREEYAPTIEMTKIQYNYIAPLIKEGQELGATFTEFWEVYKFIGASKKITPAFKSQEQAMRVWLHPETIKEVE